MSDSGPSSTSELSPGMAYEQATCSYFDHGVCQSCALLRVSPGARLDRKRSIILEALERHGLIHPPLQEIVIPRHPWQSRKKIKLSVTGTLSAPTLGIVRSDLSSEDLSDCPLTPKTVRALAPYLKRLIAEHSLMPYDIRERTGELKHIIIMTTRDERAGIVRFILRSTEAIPRIRKSIPALQEQFPWITAVSCNIQPLPAAILEGDTEIPLTESKHIQEQFGDVPLYFSSNSFMQVTPEIAEALYASGAEFVRTISCRSALDLFCGVGGFSLHIARYVTHVVGVELSETAISCARMSAKELGVHNVTFLASDAEHYLATNSERPDLIVVNPPRRGLSEGILRHISTLAPRWILYSSCNPETFARDASILQPHYSVEQLTPFDMFPMTEHCELLAILSKRS